MTAVLNLTIATATYTYAYFEFRLFNLEMVTLCYQ